MIRVQLLGSACLRSGDTVLGGPPAQRHRIALLALIVDAWPQPLSRDRALALLWPERDDARGRRLLNLAIHVLRSALGEEAIVSRGDGLLLNPAHISCDLHGLRAAIAADVPEHVVELYTASLLDGFHLAESAEFAHWLDQRRLELSRAYVRALLMLGRRQEHAGDVHAVVGTYRRLVETDPHSAEHAQRLMRALDDAGERAAALQHAAEHARRLQVDLDLGPDPDVTALAAELREAPPRRPSGSRGSSATRLASVAVLPFLNLGGNAEHEYFADGITDDVIAHLSKIRALTVISRSSVMSFKGRHQSLKEIGRILGTRTVLDATVRHAGDRVRIVATLVDVEGDRQLWAETYDRQMTDIFAIQTDVALRIAAALQAELSPDEQGRVRSGPTADIHAYRLYLQGRRFYLQYTVQGLERSVGYFERAIGRDSSFAMAHTLLAMAYIELAEQGLTAPSAVYGRAAQAVARSLELDPLSGDAHATAGYLKMVREFDWPAADAGLRRALELSPGSAYVHDLFARACWAIERYDEALPLALRAQELDPLAHRNDLTTMLLRAGRYQQALSLAEDAAEVDPRGSRPRATLGWAYFFNGKREEGVAQLESAVELSARNSLWLGQLGQAYAMTGETSKARAIVTELEERAQQAFISPYHLAYVYTGLGEMDRAMDLLERAVADRTGGTYGIKGSFLFAPLRGHPRFQALMRTMNLA
jgi:TolB-like protein/lipopolysaccharide biosynthesis regulator YciM